MKSEPKKERSIDDFKVIGQVPNQTHKIWLAQKLPLKPINEKEIKTPKYQHRWFLKEIKNDVEADCELLSQEMLRLVIGEDQAKTRVISDAKTKQLYIASKEIPDIISLQQCSIAEIKSGDLKRLGELMLCALFLGNGDASIRNIHMNKKTGKFYMLDGGWSFAHLKSKHLDPNGKFNFSISHLDLFHFPVLSIFTPIYGWLDQVVTDAKGVITRKKSGEVTELLQLLKDSPAFHEGVKKAGLKILSLSSSFIETIIKAIIKNPEHQNKFSESLISRRFELDNALTRLNSFKRYAKTQGFESDSKTFIERIKLFKTKGKYHLLDSNPKLLKDLLYTQEQNKEIGQLSLNATEDPDSTPPKNYCIWDG